jgi:sec-independent protein translocase protein TatA
MGIGNIGWTEFLVILAFALIFFGPRRLPGIAQSLGKSLREFQKALNEVKSEMARASKDVDVRSEMKQILPKPSDIIGTDLNTATSDRESQEIKNEAEVTMTPRARVASPNVKGPAEPATDSEAAEPDAPRKEDGNSPDQNVP